MRACSNALYKSVVYEARNDDNFARRSSNDEIDSVTQGCIRLTG